MPLTAKARRHVESFDRPLVDLIAADEHRIYLLVGEPEAQALAAGQVPEAVRDGVRQALEDWRGVSEVQAIGSRSGVRCR